MGDYGKADGEASAVSEEEEYDEEEEATPRRSGPRRNNIGLRVALQFPTKKSAKKSDKNDSSEPLFSSSHLLDNKKTVLGRKRSFGEGKEGEDSASECEDDSRDEGQESSDALLRRTMNIKENKAMVRPAGAPGSWRRALTSAAEAQAALTRGSCCCFGFCWMLWPGHCVCCLSLCTPSNAHLRALGWELTGRLLAPFSAPCSVPSANAGPWPIRSRRKLEIRCWEATSCSARARQASFSPEPCPCGDPQWFPDAV